MTGLPRERLFDEAPHAPLRAPAALADRVGALLESQERDWPALGGGVRSWYESRYREIPAGAFSVVLQYNPAREASAAAHVDTESVRGRPCFLCESNMPSEERGIRVGDPFSIFLNPFPIFVPHPVVVHARHSPQALLEHFPAFLGLCRDFKGRYTLLYNGSKCGASAPDHSHFQAIPRFSLPVEWDVFFVERRPGFHLRGRFAVRGLGLDAWAVTAYGRSTLVLQSACSETLANAYSLLHAALSARSGACADDWVNVLAWCDGPERVPRPGDGERWTLCVFPRYSHRPLRYTRGGGEGWMVSPGAVDMGGLLVTPRWRDFVSLTLPDVLQVFEEVSLSEEAAWGAMESAFSGVAHKRWRVSPTRACDGAEPASAAGPDCAMSAVEPARATGLEPALSVGLLECAGPVDFQLLGRWVFEGRPLGPGRYRAVRDGDSIMIETPGLPRAMRPAPLCFEPVAPGESSFLLENVRIGIGFHWDSRESLRYPGDLLLLADPRGGVTAVNRVALEEYLGCVVSSEMNPLSPREFLLAHAIISRSWLLAQLDRIGDSSALDPSSLPPVPHARNLWTERGRHRQFQVCADDHCQRYQGLSRDVAHAGRSAVEATRGTAVWAGSEVCDTRFSKCCGGVTEGWRHAWAEANMPGIRSVRDHRQTTAFPDLSIEENAAAWVRSNPESHCRAGSPELLERVLPGFDLGTKQFYRWEVVAERGELENIIRDKTGWDPGRLKEILPIRRGSSGRLSQILLLGDSDSLLLGKELEIRRSLSRSHLYSSAFVVDKEGGAGPFPDRFRFTGAGWGHGVGLCQIGAAAMAESGLSHRDILAHYYPGTGLRQVYASG